MHFSFATIIAVVPLLASATPIVQSPRVTIPISKSTNLRRDDGSVDIKALRASVAASTGKILRGFETYQRNTGERHPSQPDNYKRAVGEGALTDARQGLWYGPISVGTPAVSYTVRFDTGSSDLFLPAAECGYTCRTHEKYNPRKSSTSKSLGKAFTISYANGEEAYGQQYTDTVKISGLTAINQTLGAATDVSSGLQWPEFRPDGMLGMGFQSISDLDAPPVFQTLVSEGQTSSPVFAFKLAKPGSQLSIGGLNSSVYSDTPTYTGVTKQGYWQITFTSLTVEGSPVVGSSSAILDSGTNTIIGSTSSVEKFYKKIPGSQKAPESVGDGFYTFPCTENLPTVAFNIGGKSLPMSSTSLSLGTLSEGSEHCIGSVVADSKIGRKLWVLGDAFMVNYYTIFDYGNSRVGFANLV